MYVHVYVFLRVHMAQKSKGINVYYSEKDPLTLISLSPNSPLQRQLMLLMLLPGTLNA